MKILTDPCKDGQQHSEASCSLPQKVATASKVSSITNQFERKPDEWAALMHRVAESQDRQAYAALFQNFAPKIKSYALMQRGVFGTPELAEELVQEVMLKVWLKAKSFNPDKASVNTWLFTIARNARTDIIRKVSRGDVTLDNDAMLDIEDEVQPVDSLELLRTQKNVQELISELPTDQANVIKQIYLEGKSHSEVATENGLPLGTVKSRVRLAMARMRTATAADTKPTDSTLEKQKPPKGKPHEA